MSSIEQTLQRPPSEHIFSRFPVEVARLIFEISAMYSDRTAASLARVSKLVHTWVLPILYETVVIQQPSVLSKLFSTITSDTRHLSPSPSQPLALLIRNICINLPGRPASLFYSTCVCLPTNVGTLLRICPNLQNLHINSTHTPFRYPTNSHPNLTHLHCGSWDSWLNHDFLSFASLTHLRVDLAFNSGISPSWAPLLPPSTCLPNLTHLAIGTDRRSAPSELRGTAYFARRVLARPNLVMLVVSLWFCWASDVEDGRFVDLFAGGGGGRGGGSGSSSSGGGVDPRLCILVMASSPDDGSSVQEWEDEVRGRGSIWDKADAVMRRHCNDGRQGVPVGVLGTTTSIIDYR